jgi:hypothetical protein
MGHAGRAHRSVLLWVRWRKKKSRKTRSASICEQTRGEHMARESTFEARSKVLDFRVGEEEIALVIDGVKVLAMLAKLLPFSCVSFPKKNPPPPTSALAMRTWPCTCTRERYLAADARVRAVAVAMRSIWSMIGKRQQQCGSLSVSLDCQDVRVRHGVGRCGKVKMAVAKTVALLCLVACVTACSNHDWFTAARTGDDALAIPCMNGEHAAALPICLL